MGTPTTGASPITIAPLISTYSANVAVTPDDSTVLVTNWCTYDMSIIDAATATEVARVPIGRYPRGIVVSPEPHPAPAATLTAPET